MDMESDKTGRRKRRKDDEEESGKPSSSKRRLSFKTQGVYYYSALYLIIDINLLLCYKTFWTP